MILHHVPGARSMRVLWLIEELGLDCTLQNWSLTDGGLRSAAFLALSPAGRIPALEIDGRAIFESGAIVQYLTERQGRLAPAPGTPERAISPKPRRRSCKTSISSTSFCARPRRARRP
jgi:glutathione S-transferase